MYLIKVSPSPPRERTTNSEDVLNSSRSPSTASTRVNGLPFHHPNTVSGRSGFARDPTSNRVSHEQSILLKCTPPRTPPPFDLFTSGASVISFPCARCILYLDM